MLQFEELRLELNDNKQKLSELREALGLDALKEEIAKLEEQTAAEEFWGDIENSQKVLQRISQLKNKVAAYTSLETAFDDTMTLIELADEENDCQIEEEYGESRADRAHRVHHHSGLVRTREHGEEPCYELEDRVSRRVSDLKFVR